MLVVDDEEPIRHALTKFLGARGYAVSAAESGELALDILQQERFDALICDVRMPGMAGTEVVARALARHPDLAVLMLTAVNDAPTATDALARGAMDYLMKPIELADLARAVERAIQRRDLERQQRNVERLIQDEVELRTEGLRRERAELADVVIGLVRSLVHAQEAKNEFLRGNSERVSATAAAIGSALRLPETEVRDCGVAGLLRDVGIIGVPEALLRKPGPLTADEFAQVKEHVRIGVDLLSPIAPLAPVLAAVRDHHEHWDGGGYPRQLAGNQISLGGRILAAADAYVALTSRRAYREPLRSAGAIDLLSAHVDAQLDPTVFAALREVAR